MSPTKRPWVAGMLNFVFPGLGLLYLGRKKAALVNFLLANLALVFAILVYAEPTLIEHIHWLVLGILAMSAGYAHGIASSEARLSSEVPT